jgi:MFS family permease
MPIVGSLGVALALLLLSTITPTTPVWLICVFIGVMGAGLGLSMQILVLIVQNTFPNRVVGTATASNNYFRQIGATLGSAVVGSLFTARVAELLGERLPARGMTLEGGVNSLTPELVSALPAALQSPIIQSYNDALTPLFLYMAPLGVIAAILLAFVHEKALSTVIERDTRVEREAGIPPEPAKTKALN